MIKKFEYRIENGSLIIDNYFNNLKIGSINCGGVESILGKCELFDKEYVALLKENQQLKDNWNKLKEYIQKDYGFYDKSIVPEFGCAMGALNRIKDKMQELEQGSDSNVND